MDYIRCLLIISTSLILAQVQTVSRANTNSLQWDTTTLLDRVYRIEVKNDGTDTIGVAFNTDTTTFFYVYNSERWIWEFKEIYPGTIRTKVITSGRADTSYVKRRILATK